MAQSRGAERTKRKDNGTAPSLVLVDGSNVAHSSEGEQGHLSNILLVCDKLREEGYEPLVLVDAALRHQIDNRAEYERMIIIIPNPASSACACALRRYSEGAPPNSSRSMIIHAPMVRPAARKPIAVLMNRRTSENNSLASHRRARAARR